MEKYPIGDTTTEGENSAELPVPVTPLPEGRKRERVRRKTQLYILLWLASTGEITSSGQRRLNRLLETSSPDEQLRAYAKALSLSSDIRWQRRLQSQIRTVQSYFRAPRSRSKFVKRRIGVGYRDKGQLRPFHLRGISDANRDAFLFQEDLPSYLPTVRQKGWILPEEYLDGQLSLMGFPHLGYFTYLGEDAVQEIRNRWLRLWLQMSTSRDSPVSREELQ